jgi:hypothetical protein
MDTVAIRELINDYKHLFWYTPENEKENIDYDLLVETILNYGDEKAVKRLISSMGIEKVAAIFKKHLTTSNRRKNNYHELISNYFQLYFSRHAKEYTI